jgi:hypothetical protein
MVVKYKFTNIVYFHVVWKILHVTMVGRVSYLYGAYAWFLCYFGGFISANINSQRFGHMGTRF